MQQARDTLFKHEILQWATFFSNYFSQIQRWLLFAIVFYLCLFRTDIRLIKLIFCRHFNSVFADFLGWSTQRQIIKNRVYSKLYYNVTIKIWNTKRAVIGLAAPLNFTIAYGWNAKGNVLHQININFYAASWYGSNWLKSNKKSNWTR